MTNIKKLRIASGMSQLRLAQEMGVAQPTVSAWENGVKYPSGEKLKKLAALFGASVDSLLEDGSGLAPDVLREASGFDSAFEDLTQDEIIKLAEFARFLKSQRGNG